MTGSGERIEIGAVKIVYYTLESRRRDSPEVVIRDVREKAFDII